MSHRQKTTLPTISDEVVGMIRPWCILCGALTSAATVLLGGITAIGISAALSWHLIRWSWTERLQLAVMVLVLLTGIVLWRIDRHTVEERDHEA